MKKTFRKLCCVCLVVSMIFSLLAIDVFAACDHTEEKHMEFIAAVTNADEKYIEFSPYIKQSHPRLYVDSFSGLKEKYLSDPVTKKWYNDLLNEVALISEEGVMCFHTGDNKGKKLYDIDKLTSTEHIRSIISTDTILDRFYALAFAAACEDSQAIADRLWLEIEDAINLPNWHTGHWLETAEMMHSMAIAYDWCYKFWDDTQKKAMEDVIYKFGLKHAFGNYAYDENKHKYCGNWYKWCVGLTGIESGNNWVIVCNTGILMASLAIYEAAPERHDFLINTAVRSIRAGLNAYSPNGAYREPFSYWRYATDNLIMAVDSFENAIVGGFESLPSIDAPFMYDFSKMPGVSVTPEFPMYANGSAGNFGYGDATGGGITSSPASMWIANRFNSPQYTDYHLNALEKKGLGGENLPLDLLWYEGGKIHKEYPTDRLFEDDFVSMRSSWNDDALFVAMKCGKNGRSHQHYDLSTFVLDVFGTRFARTNGAIDYDGAGRSKVYRGRTEGQNAVVINPDETAGQNTSGTSEITHFYSGNTSAYAILDMTDAYDKAVKSTGEVVETAVESARRGVKMFSNKSRIIVQDEFEMNAPSEFYWFMHTGAKISLYNNGKSAVLANGGKVCYVNLLSNAEDAKFEVMDPLPLPTSPNPDNQKKAIGKKLAVHLKDVTDVSLAVEFVPVVNGSASFREEITALDSWHPEVGVEREGRNVKIYGVEKGGTVTMVTLSPFGEIVGIDQKKTDTWGEYTLNVTLPKEYKNGTYSVFTNGKLYKTFDVTDGVDSDRIPVSYSVPCEIPSDSEDFVIIAAEYNDSTLIQLSEGIYSDSEMTSTAVFGRAPQKGSTIKFLFLRDLESLTPLRPAKEFVIK